MSNTTYTVFEPHHHGAAYALWQHTEGVGLSDADTEIAITQYLAHHKGMSFVALADGKLVGTVLCGHDQRRGYLHHVAVDSNYRRRGIARELVRLAVDALRVDGITKCHLFLLEENQAGREFWQHLGWQLRNDIQILSLQISSCTSDCRC